LPQPSPLPAQQTNRNTRTNTNTNRNTTQRNTGNRTSGQGRTGGDRQYQNSTMLGDATITSNAETRRLIIVTDDETNENIKQVIESLDRPKPQVLINVVFLQVTHNKDLDLGTEFSRTGTELGNNLTSTATTLFGAPQTGGFYNLVNTDINATISALSKVGKTEILSRPSILARSSQQATIMVGQEVPFITNSRISDTGQTTNTVQYQDIGIILRVTPFITSEGLVEMIVTPEISALSDRTVAISDTVNTPVIDKRSADTVVVTPSDRTVVIGGLISNQTTNTDSKVPLLGDIPLLGHAFKRTIKQNTKTELLIFLTPHVVQHPDDLSKLTRPRAGQTRAQAHDLQAGGREQVSRQTLSGTARSAFTSEHRARRGMATMRSRAHPGVRAGSQRRPRERSRRKTHLRTSGVTTTAPPGATW
jgi:general secretion pathway protein D